MKDEYVKIGKLDIKILSNYFKVKTEKLIITKERINHINKRHGNDYDKYGRYISEVIKNPEYILIDVENENTVLYLKSIKELNLQVVVKIYTEDNLSKSNTVITFWHMRKRSYNQIISKNKKIYENIDKKE